MKVKRQLLLHQIPKVEQLTKRRSLIYATLFHQNVLINISSLLEVCIVMSCIRWMALDKNQFLASPMARPIQLVGEEYIQVLSVTIRVHSEIPWCLEASFLEMLFNAVGIYSSNNYSSKKTLTQF